MRQRAETGGVKREVGESRHVHPPRSQRSCEVTMAFNSGAAPATVSKNASIGCHCALHGKAIEAASTMHLQARRPACGAVRDQRTALLKTLRRATGGRRSACGLV